MSDEVVRIQWRDSRCDMHLSRPSLGNALSFEVVSSLRDALLEAAARQSRFAVLQGDGRNFCTGFDLSNLSQETDETLMMRFVRIELLLQQVFTAPFRTACVAQGRSMGAGADLFAACDLRLAMPEASFAFPGWRGFGIVLGSRRLAARVGDAVAMDWIRSGRQVSAQEALDAGLVNAIVRTDVEIDSAIAEWSEGSAVSDAIDEAINVRNKSAMAADLAALVHSVAQPGLHARVSNYVQRQQCVRRQS